MRLAAATAQCKTYKVTKRTVYQIASIAGPIFLMAGMAGMFGFGIPDPYWLFSVVLGAFLIYYSQKESKRLSQKGLDTGYIEPTMQQKKRRFWLFVPFVVVGCLIALIFCPQIRNTSPTLLWTCAPIVLVCCLGLVWYGLFKKSG